MSLKNGILHFKTITRHRHLVLKHCFKVGLYRQGLLHDLSKYNPVEFQAGARYFQGNLSPNNIERENLGYSKAWLHHKGRNKHHFEYWIDYDPNPPHHMTGMEMPVCYVVEMFCDRVSACKNYEKENYSDASAYEYYIKGKDKCMMHKNTEALLCHMLEYLRDNGEEATNLHIRKDILHNK